MDTTAADQGSNKGFWGSLSGDMTLFAAHAAVVRIDVHHARVTGVLHQPCMNDLHHVLVLEDQLHVANTGLGARQFWQGRSFLESILPARMGQRSSDQRR